MSVLPTDFDPKKIGWRFVFYLPQFARLFWGLFRDQRVSVWAKSVLVLAIVYVIAPMDLIPDLTPFLGEMDDLALVILACRAFLSLCPDEVVREHVRRIDRRKT